MKKTVLIFFILACIIAGCGDKNIKTSDGYDLGAKEPNTEIAQVPFQDTVLGRYDFSFDTEAFDDEEKEKIKSDVVRNLSVIEETLGKSDVQITLYFVKTFASGKIYRENNCVFCSKELADSTDLYVNVLMTAYDPLPYWKAVGISEALFEYAPRNEKTQVCAYLESESSKYFTTMFPLFFKDDFSDDKTVEMAKDCAYYIAQKEIDEGRGKEFVSNDFSDAWFKDLGYNGSVPYDEIDAKIASMEYNTGTYTEPTLSDERMMFIISRGFCSGDTTDIYDFFRMYYKEIDGVIAAVAADAPLWYEGYKSKGRVQAFLSEEGDSTRSIATGKDKVIVGSGEDIFHEYLHACTLDQNCSEYPWVVEGVATYYSAKAQGKYKKNPEKMLSLLNSEEVPDEFNGRKLSILDKEFLKIYRKKYFEMEGKFPKSIDEYNGFSANYACGIADWTIDSKSDKNIFVHQNSFSDIKTVPDSSKYANMTYSSSMVLCDYVIKHYGADPLLSVCAGHQTLEEAIGLSFEELREEFLKQLDKN